MENSYFNNVIMFPFLSNKFNLGEFFQKHYKQNDPKQYWICLTEHIGFNCADI